MSVGRLMLRTVAKDALAGGFDDIEVRVLVEAFDEAWKRVQEDGGSPVGTATLRPLGNYSLCVSSR